MKLKDYFLSYGIAFIPIVATAHISKSIIKSVSRIPYFQYSFNDVAGMETAGKIISGEIVLQKKSFLARGAGYGTADCRLFGRNMAKYQS